MQENILLLADIHANDTALQAVLQDAAQRYGALPIWFLGDLFGRGPHPLHVWQRLLAHDPEVMVAGNHDWGVIGQKDTVIVGDSYEGEFKPMVDLPIIRAHRRELVQAGLLEWGNSESRVAIGGEVLTLIQQWPLISSPRVGIVVLHGGADHALNWHGDAWEVTKNLDHNVWGYVKEAQHVKWTFEVLDWLCGQPTLQMDLGESLRMTEPDLVLVGHLHRRRLAWAQKGEVHWESKLELNVPYLIPTSSSTRLLVSPGSVGFPYEDQSRDACYAVLTLEDGKAQSITFYEVAYDRQRVQAAMRRKFCPYPDGIERAYPEDIVKRLNDVASELTNKTQERA